MIRDYYWTNILNKLVNFYCDSYFNMDYLDLLSLVIYVTVILTALGVALGVVTEND